MFCAIIIAYMKNLYFVLFVLVLLYYYYQEVRHLILAFEFLFTFIKVRNAISVKTQN